MCQQAFDACHLAVYVCVCVNIDSLEPDVQSTSVSNTNGMATTSSNHAAAGGGGGSTEFDFNEFFRIDSVRSLGNR